LLSTPLWADGARTAVIVVVVLLAPLLAAGVTWRGERQPRWLTWALVAILGLAIVGSVLMLLV
jgi:membrane protein YdbS with pleckstrin-like domain